MGTLRLGNSVVVPSVITTSSGPKYYIEKELDANNKLVNSDSIINLKGAMDIGDYTLYNVYYYASFPSNTTVDFSSLISISGVYGCYQMFYATTGITNVNLSSLTTISGSSSCYGMFRECRDLTNVNLSSLTTISGSSGCYYMFMGCTNLVQVNFSSLSVVNNSYVCRYMFRGCTGLTSLSFPALNSSSFDSNTNQFNGMLQGVTGCTVHFPSNLQSVIGSWSDVQAGFGGTNTSVLYDLPATE